MEPSRGMPGTRPLSRWFIHPSTAHIRKSAASIRALVLTDKVGARKLACDDLAGCRRMRTTVGQLAQNVLGPVRCRDHVAARVARPAGYLRMEVLACDEFRHALERFWRDARQPRGPRIQFRVSNAASRFAVKPRRRRNRVRVRNLSCYRVRFRDRLRIAVSHKRVCAVHANDEIPHQSLQVPMLSGEAPQAGDPKTRRTSPSDVVEAFSQIADRHRFLPRRTSSGRTQTNSSAMLSIRSGGSTLAASMGPMTRSSGTLPAPAAANSCKMKFIAALAMTCELMWRSATTAREPADEPDSEGRQPVAGCRSRPLGSDCPCSILRLPISVHGLARPLVPGR